MTKRPPGNQRPVSQDVLSGGLLRSTLPRKTQFGFVAATLAVFVIAFLSYRSLQWRAEGAALMQRTLEIIQSLDDLLSEYKDAETGQRGYLLTQSESYLEPYDRATAAIDSKLVELRAEVANDPKQAQTLEVLRHVGQQKLNELKLTIDLARSGHRDEALEAVKTGRGKRYMDDIRAGITDLKDAEKTRLAIRTSEWERASTISLGVVWGGAALLLFLVVGAALMSSHDFHAQEVERWLRTGQAELAASMQGVETVEGVGERIAAFLGSYVSARIGAVYFAEKAGSLRRVGSFALPSSASSAVRVAGLTAQAYTDNAFIETDDVPADFFPITSGLGQSRARRLLAAPTTADGAPNGALELGFFHRERPAEIELVRRVTETIGLALRSARDRRVLQETLEETQRQAEELQTQQEELSVQNEELEQQSRALQESQARLENQQAELEQINSNLEEQTQALEQQRNDLLRAQAELNRASAYKSEFLANMSHELRTPLNSTLILAKLLADNRSNNLTPEQIKFAETIYSAGNDLLTLINDILDLSKIEAGKLDVRPEEIAVARLCDELVDVFRPVARDKGIDLTTTVDADVPTAIVTDEVRAQQVLRNLLSNALKFTERGGVSLHVRREGARVAFSVKDTGIGVAPEQHEVIFEAFRQADGTTNRKYGGTGLGLSISRDLARLLGGEIQLASAPGSGSVFTLIVPRVAPATAPPRRAPEPPRAAASGGAPSNGGNGGGGNNGSSGTHGKHGRTLLVIEDDSDFAQIVAGVGREHDYQLIVTSSADEGVQLAGKHLPAAIVLDLGLRDRSGLSVLDRLKRNPATRHIPVHVVSSRDEAQAALELGAVSYLRKPVERGQLEATLARVEQRTAQAVKRVLVVEDDA
ncbi:MAG TPA: CHASE3 domain-containing protein, partial [Polyangia bacterium]|nr:CHASE3 domain-containing protein [Polyangia bacterium]